MAFLGYRSSGGAGHHLLLFSVLLAFVCESWHAGAGRAEDNGDVRSVELRPTNMLRRKPATRPSLVELSKKRLGDTCEGFECDRPGKVLIKPAHKDEDWHVCKGKCNEEQCCQDLQVDDLQAGWAPTAHIGGQMQDISTAAGHIKQIADRMTIKRVLNDGTNVLKTTLPLEKSMNDYASNLMMVPFAGQTFARNLAVYHGKVQKDINSALKDASVPELESTLESYYVHKPVDVNGGGSARVRPVEFNAKSNDPLMTQVIGLDKLPALAEDYYLPKGTNPAPKAKG